MEGKNTLGCKINGKNWVASVGFNLSGDQAFRMGYDSASGHFGINSWWIDKSKGIEQNLSFESIFSNQILNFHKLILNPQDINYLVINNIWKSYHIDTNLNNFIEILFLIKVKNNFWKI